MKKSLFNTNIIISLLFLIIGLFLFFNPEGTINLISGAIGTVLLIAGVISIIKYLKNVDNSNKFDIVYGVILCVSGIVLLTNPGAVASILPFTLGIYFIVRGIFKIGKVIDIKNKTGFIHTPTLIITILIIACGLFFLTNPFSGALAITKVIGLLLSIYSILEIVNYFLLKKDFKEAKYIIKE